MGIQAVAKSFTGKAIRAAGHDPPVYPSRSAVPPRWPGGREGPYGSHSLRPSAAGAPVKQAYCLVRWWAAWDSNPEPTD